MFNKLIKVTSIAIIIIGTALVAFSVVTGAQLFDGSIVQKTTTNVFGYKWTYYVFNMGQYKQNIENSLNILTFSNAIPSIPQLPIWPNLSNDVTQITDNIQKILKFIAKCLILIPNYIIFIFNVGLLPAKLFLYPIRIIITLMGLNTADEGFINVVETISTIFIPYIPTNF